MNIGDEMDKLEENILVILRKADAGLTIEEVSERLSIHRITASKYLAVLEARNLINHRPIGKAKLFWVKK